MHLRRHQGHAVTIMTRSVAHMLLARKAAGWTKWVLVVRRELEHSHKRVSGLAAATAACMMRRVVLRTLQLRLASAWRAWLQHSERTLQLEQERERAATRVVKAVWCGWVQHVEQTRQLRHQQERTANLTVSGT